MKLNFKTGVYAFVAIAALSVGSLYANKTEYQCSARTDSVELSTPYFVSDAYLWISVKDNISAYTTSGLLNWQTIDTDNGQVSIMYDENDHYKFAKSKGNYFFMTKYNNVSYYLYNCKKI